MHGGDPGRSRLQFVTPVTGVVAYAPPPLEKGMPQGVLVTNQITASNTTTKSPVVGDAPVLHVVGAHALTEAAGAHGRLARGALALHLL